MPRPEMSDDPRSVTDEMVEAAIGVLKRHGYYIQPSGASKVAVHEALSAALAVDPLRQSVAGDAVEIGRMAYHDWCREHDKRDPWPYTRAIEACIAAVDRARSDTPGVAALAVGVPDDYLIRENDGWWRAPGDGVTISYSEAHHYTRKEADKAIQKWSGGPAVKIIHASETALPEPPPFPPWSAEVWALLLAATRRCMINESGHRILEPLLRAAFSETPDAG